MIAAQEVLRDLRSRLLGWMRRNGDPALLLAKGLFQVESRAGQENRAVQAVTLKEAKLNLEQLVEKVIENAEPTIVVTESGEQVVFLPLDEYNSWKETLYLLSSPANADRLRKSMAEAQAGKAQEREFLDWEEVRRELLDQD